MQLIPRLLPVRVVLAGVLLLSPAVASGGIPGATDEVAPAEPAGVTAPAPVPATPAARATNLNVHASTDVAGYADSDHVYIFTPGITGTVSNPTSGWDVSGSYLVDVVSAASADIVSTASRRWEEVRQVGSLSGNYKPGTFGGGAHAYVSSEPDYLAVSGGGNLTQDFAQKNATWLLGYDYGHDVSGRTGTPWSVFSHPIDRHSFKAGLTLVLDRATIASFVADASAENGDTSKPYRFIPLFSAGANLPNGASAALVSATRIGEKPLEQLPTSRFRSAISAQLAHRFRASTLRADERLYVDSWGLKATSSDARFLFDVGRRVTFGPHLRLHAQTSVDFWQRAYTLGAGGAIPQLRAGDRELGPLYTVTGGAMVRVGVGPREEPSSWVIGLDVNGAETHYLDDLYLTDRLSLVSSFVVETDL
jgi:hypothetical protein